MVRKTARTEHYSRALPFASSRHVVSSIGLRKAILQSLKTNRTSLICRNHRLSCHVLESPINPSFVQAADTAYVPYIAFTASGWLKDTEFGPVRTATAPGYWSNSSVTQRALFCCFRAFASGIVLILVNQGPGSLLKGEKKSRYTTLQQA